jgi:hypothetical protein
MLDRTLQTLRTIHAAMLGSTVFFGIIVFIRDPAPRFTTPPFFPLLFYFLAAVNVAFAIFFFSRGAMVTEAGEKLRLNPDDSAALRDFQKGYIIAFALAESAIIFGVVVRFLGGSWNHALALAAIGIVSLLLCTPRRP